MIKKSRMTYCVWATFVVVIIICWFLKCFNLSWVESNTSYSKITINFLFPMQQETFKEHIQLVSKREGQTAFDCSVQWLNEQVVELKLKEQNPLKGQKVQLIIDKAPSKIKGLTKSAKIPVQFKADIELLSPTSNLLISSTSSFIVTFNTPIDIKQLSKWLQCDTAFNIEPCKLTTAAGKEIKDDTRYLLTPKTALENGKKYILLLRAGMRSKSGTYLKQNQAITLQVDQKPYITKTYPIDGDKWIGLYPRILLESQEDIVGAEAYLNGNRVKGKLTDSKHAYFLLDGLLRPETQYELTFQTQVASGEVSEPRQVHFTTTTIANKRFWIEIRLGNQKQIYCYEGEKCIRIIPFELGSKKDERLLGTYYLQGKAEVYEDAENNLGGNYWLMISDQLGIQGQLRDAYWQPSENKSLAKNIIVSDEEALWLYKKSESETMVIVRK